MARRGEQLGHHFGHHGAAGERACAGGPETALHRFAKELLAAKLTLALPPLHRNGEQLVLDAGGPYRFDAAVLEHRFGPVIPDVIVRRANRDLFVEFCVTHACDAIKIAKIARLGTAAIEVDLSRLGQNAPRAELEAATVVRLDVEPVPTSVVTGSVTFGVLVELSDDAGRRAAAVELVAAFNGIAERRRLEIAIEHSVDPDATRCEPGIVQLFERAVEASGHPVRRLAQGMATDASNMAVIAPIGLVLIRCHDGVGWGPAGTVDPADIEAGLDVLTFVIGVMANSSDTPAGEGPRVDVRLDASAARKLTGGAPF